MKVNAMPYNGSGSFSRVYNWVSDAAAAIPITAARVDAEDDGFATGLSTAICKDGQTTVTADLPLSGFKFTGVGNAAARTQFATVAQIQDSTYNWVVSGGTADIITATYAPAVAALVDGMELSFRATGANTVTTPSFSPNGVTAHTITQNGGSPLGIASIPGALFEGKLRYNLANTRWELQNPSVLSAPFLDTNPLVKGSSDATKLFRIEVDGNTTGTTRVMTPPDADFTAVGTATAQTTSNKKMVDSTTTFVDDGDNTKQLAIQCSGITTGTTRTLTAQDASGTIALTSNLTGSTAYQNTPGNPTGTSDLTGKMMGLGGAITPGISGVVCFMIAGDVQSSSSTGGASMQIRYGTGAAPANGAALTGTTAGPKIKLTEVEVLSDAYPFACFAIITGLTPLTAYWFDLGLAAISGGTATAQDIQMSAFEIK